MDWKKVVFGSRAINNERIEARKCSYAHVQGTRKKLESVGGLGKRVGGSVGGASIENLWEAHRWAASKPSMVTRGPERREEGERERERETERLEAGIDWNIFINLACFPTV